MTTIAIDFGTSNTVVSILEADTQQPKTIRLPQISRLFRMKAKNGDLKEISVIPSLVFIKEPNHLILGEKVCSQRLGLSQPQRLFKAFKRDLAADFQPPPRQLDEQLYTPELVAKLFIQEIWQHLNEQQVNPDKVIFTVPVGAFERYFNWFRDLGKQLGVTQVQLIDESTAAALGYAVKSPGSLVLVIDFGGGTLDLSLVRTINHLQEQQSNEIQGEVIAKSDAYIGGEDIDIWIVEDYLRKIGFNKEKLGAVGLQNLLEIAEKLKIRLSKEQEVTESWLDENTFMSHEIKLDRENLEVILENQQFFSQLRNKLDEVLSIANARGISKNDIERVLLVGGSCLIPAVQQLVTFYFGREKVSLDKPFEAVSYGALALSQIKVLDDYLRHSYAIRLWEPYTKSYTYLTLFEKGLKYPCQRNESLILQVATPGQTEIRLDIGEVAEISKAEVIYDKLGRMTSTRLEEQIEYRSLESRHYQQVCVAHLNPPGELGVDRIEVYFEVDSKRALLATVTDLITGKVLVEKKSLAKFK